MRVHSARKLTYRLAHVEHYRNHNRRGIRIRKPKGDTHVDVGTECGEDGLGSIAPLVSHTAAVGLILNDKLA